MSCDYELANEWAGCSGKNASYMDNNEMYACGGSMTELSFSVGTKRSTVLATSLKQEGGHSVKCLSL